MMKIEKVPRNIQYAIKKASALAFPIFRANNWTWIGEIPSQRSIYKKYLELYHCAVKDETDVSSGRLFVSYANHDVTFCIEVAESTI